MIATSGALRRLQALGDDQRIVIVEMLAGGPCSVQELARDLPVSRPAVSRHLRVLREAGLVEADPVGTRRVYRLRPDSVRELSDYLHRFWDEPMRRFAFVAENRTPRGGVGG